MEQHELRLLLRHFVHDSGNVFPQADDLPDENRRAFFDACERRRSGEPLQYILGEWEFFGLRMLTDARALIPRPETELLVERVLQTITPQSGGTDPGRCVRILDMCTGSGCIAVALAVKLREAGIAAQIVATDICGDALSLAAENAALHGVSEYVRFVQEDLAAGLLGSEPFALIVSNPPYIRTDALAALQTEVRKYEPRLALDGGADGMGLYRRLLPQAYALLVPGGRLFLEIGPIEVTNLVHGAGFADVRCFDDYAGLPRIIQATR